MEQSQPQLGKLLDKPEARDAIHIAILPVESGDQKHLTRASYLKVIGTRSKYCPMLATYRTIFIVVGVDRKEEADGVLDCYLDEGANLGDEVWMQMFPYSIKSLRHAWTHDRINTFADVPRILDHNSYDDLYSDDSGDYEDIVESEEDEDE